MNIPGELNHEPPAAERFEFPTRLERVLSASGIGTWTWDILNGTLAADDTLALMLSLPPEDAAGGRLQAYLEAVHPEDRDRVARAVEAALASGETYSAEYRILQPDGSDRWLVARGRVERDPQGKAVTLDGIVIDITERVEREQRDRFLAEMAERARTLTDPDDVIADAVNSLGRFLRVSRCVFVDIDIEADTCTTSHDYCADSSVNSMVGVTSLSAFGAPVVAEYGAGNAVAVDDVYAAPEQVPLGSLPAYDAYAIRSHCSVPVVHSARLVTCIGAHSAVPRHWHPEEIQLLRTVVERTWLTVEVARQEQALRRSEERYRLLVEGAKDYAMILTDTEGRITSWNLGAERIMGWTETEALGQSADLIFTPEDRANGVPEMEMTRAAAEGRALDLRWQLRKDGSRYYADGIMESLRGESGNIIGFAKILRDATDRRTLEQERSRFVSLAENSTDFIGMSGMDDVPLYVNPAGLRMVGLADMGQARQMRGIEFFHEDDRDIIMRDLLPVALREGHAEAEVRLRHFETGKPLWVNYTLFTLTDTAGELIGLATVSRDISERKSLDAERERLAERERTIASQLQESLQPPLPDRVPGLTAGSYTRPALSEASVGGDFYDLFPLDKELYALVIGDVSGKGLAAAQQLALIRNSLRTTLYLSRAPAQAATSLNTILTAHDLLTGFVTAFVGVYNGATGEIAYASCGHEPGLIRRMNGSVEELKTTGPPLGVEGGIAYGEDVFTLAAGETLLLYTDGLSEAGPSRRELLGTKGLSELLAALPPSANIQREAEVLVSRVNRLSGGVFRDDVAVLLARRL